ncbi:flagellar basal body-associated FliL family protein [Clostridium sp.]|uniref:flagellar basal body-associated FliL family protein n=1 Tax=Clostridium sp. TaxID=1506 RepID=UPI002FCBED53
MAVEKKEKKAKKGSKVVLIIFGVVLGLLLIGGVAFGGYYIAAKNAPSPSNEHASSEKGSAGQELTFEVDEILVNLADEGKPRYLKIKIFIGHTDNEELKSELTTKKPIIRDTINNTLRTKKTTDLTAEGEEVLKNVLSEKINDLLTTGKITNVYFSEILIQ